MGNTIRRGSVHNEKNLRLAGRRQDKRLKKDQHAEARKAAAESLH